MDDHKRPPRDGSSDGALDVAFAASNDAPARARAELMAWLKRTPTGAGLVDDARLLISELVTNCVRHAQITSDQPLRLTASLRMATLRLAIHDGGTNGTIVRRTPKNDGAGGFGLDLVARISSAWGVERNAHGTTVWLELDPTRERRRARLGAWIPSS